MLRSGIIGVLAIGFVSAGGIAQTASPEAPTSVIHPKKEKKICRRSSSVVSTGTLLGSSSVCKTAAEWEAIGYGKRTGKDPASQAPRATDGVPSTG